MSNFIDDRINTRPSAVTDERLLLLTSFLQQIASFSNMLSTLVRDIVISVLAFGLSASRDFIGLLFDDDRTKHKMNIEYTIRDEQRQQQRSQSSTSIGLNTASSIFANTSIGLNIASSIFDTTSIGLVIASSIFTNTSSGLAIAFSIFANTSIGLGHCL
jgi:hypothetical protein